MARILGQGTLEWGTLGYLKVSNYDEGVIQSQPNAGRRANSASTNILIACPTA